MFDWFNQLSRPVQIVLVVVGGILAVSVIAIVASLAGIGEEPTTNTIERESVAATAQPTVPTANPTPYLDSTVPDTTPTPEATPRRTPEPTPTEEPTPSPTPIPTLTPEEVQCQKEREYLTDLSDKLGRAAQHTQETGQLMVMAGEGALLQDLQWQLRFATAYIQVQEDYGEVVLLSAPESLWPLQEAASEFVGQLSEGFYRVDEAIEAINRGYLEEAELILAEAEEILLEAEPLGQTVADLLEEALAVDRSEC